MGACSTCTKDISYKTQDEALIGSFEKALGYFEFDCTQMVKGIDYLQNRGKLTNRKMKIMLETLHLQHARFDDLVTPLGRFYNKFLDDEGYSATRLELLSTLLCNGELSDKAHNLLFAAGVRTQSQMSWTKVVWLLGDLSLIALDILPEYAGNSLYPGSKTYSTLALDNYRKLLKESIPDTVKSLEEKILGKKDAISSQELRGRIETGELAVLCSASGLRTYALEVVRMENTEASLSTLREK